MVAMNDEQIELLLEPQEALKFIGESIKWLVDLPVVKPQVASVLAMMEMRNGDLLLPMMRKFQDSWPEFIVDMALRRSKMESGEFYRKLKCTPEELLEGVETFRSLVSDHEDDIDEVQQAEIRGGLVLESMVGSPKSLSMASQMSYMTPSKKSKKTNPLGVKRAKIGTSEPKSVGVMEEKQMRKRAMAVDKLMAIVRRAGPAAQVNHNKTHLEEEAFQELIRSFMGTGSPDYANGVANGWQRFEQFLTDTGGGAPYPPTQGQLLSYGLSLVAQDCGPTVLPTLLQQVKFICERIGMPDPEVEDYPFFKKLIEVQKQVKAKEVLQAEHWPVEVIKLLEKGVFAPIKVAFRIFSWFITVAIYASLRFGDTLRVRPRDLELCIDSLMGKCWETKTCRNGKFMKWGVPNCSFTPDCEWLTEGYRLYNEEFEKLHEEIKERVDFMMPMIDKNGKLNWTDSMDYRKAVALIRYLLGALARSMLKEDDPIYKQVMEFIERLKGFHGIKATIPTLMVEVGEDAAAKLQGHWLSSTMVDRYNRQKLALPKAVLWKICNDFKRGVPMEGPSKHITPSKELPSAPQQLDPKSFPLMLLDQSQGGPSGNECAQKFQEVMEAYTPSVIVEEDHNSSSIIMGRLAKNFAASEWAKKLARRGQSEDEFGNISPVKLREEAHKAPEESALESSPTASAAEETEETQEGPKDPEGDLEVTNIKFDDEDSDGSFEKLDGSRLSLMAGDSTLSDQAVIHLMEAQMGSSDEEYQTNDYVEVEEDMQDFINATSLQGVVSAKEICKYSRKLKRKEEYRYKDGPKVLVDSTEGVDIYTPYFWVSKQAEFAKLSHQKEYKIHINEVGQWDVLACHRKKDLHVYLGSEIPEGADLCKQCLKNRPELAHFEVL